jgi:2-succinyl-5-enolpyruvyl-6-hydroxy-3-cyclohexene-1-carboxylate synthase
VIVQLGAEPVAAAWPAFLARARDAGASRWVLAGPRWTDSDSSADGVLLGEVARSVRDLAVGLALAERTSASSLRRRVERDAASLAWRDDWRAIGERGVDALVRARQATPGNEVDAIAGALVALPAGAVIQVGNSLPIRTIDHASARHHPDTQTRVVGTLPIGPDSRSEPRSGERERAGMLGADPAWHAGLQGLQCSDNTIVLAQRGAAGIDGLIASAAGATRAGRPVLLVLGDVSFAHDLGGLLAARAAVAPLAILVIDNAGGRIFEGLPIGDANLGEAFERHWLTAPNVDVVAVSTALGLGAVAATTPATIADALATALTGAADKPRNAATACPLVTVIHAPVSSMGAREVRTAAIAILAEDARAARPSIEPTTATRATRESARMTIGERP